MDDYKELSNGDLLNKFEKMVEDKESAPTSLAYDEYCEDIEVLKSELLLRMNRT